MSKKGQLRISHPIGDPLSLQQVDQRQRTFMLPVENCCLRGTSFCHLCQIDILRFSGSYRYLFDLLHAFSGCTHMLFMAQGVFLYKMICRRHDICIRPEIFLHQQYFRASMPLFKFQKCLRVSRPESIDALILITHHEQIICACCQQCNDRVLDLGGILCFIHTDVGIQLLKILQQPWDLLQHHIGIDHLIVIIDHLQFFQFAAIFPVDHRDLALCPFIQSLDLVLVKHHIFNVGNQRADIFQISVCGIYPFHPLVDLCQDTCNPLFIIQKLMGRLPCSIAIILQHFGTDAVDGPKFQLSCQL